MGFRLNRTYDLEFTGQMAGAEVKMRSGTIAVTQALIGSEADEAVDILVDHIISWNFVKEDGTPLPIEAEAIKAELEDVVVIKIGQEWLKAVRGITAPLDEESTSGSSSPEVSIPTEPL